MFKNLFSDLGMKLLSLGLAIMVWWIIKIGAELRYPAEDKLPGLLRRTPSVIPTNPPTQPTVPDRS